MAAISGTGGGPERAVPGARSALAALIFINLFNYIDRQVLYAVLPQIGRASCRERV